jgi:NAD(P)H-nitrite reductase large subunit
MKKVAIIGNGISGITAARHIRKGSDYEITIISDETDHFYSRTALMYIYMGHMQYKNIKPYEDWFWAKNRFNLVRDYVKGIEFENRRLLLSKNGIMEYDVLIIATGSRPNKFGWPGQDLAGVQGLYGMPDLENMEKFTKEIDRAVIIGGGLIGIEMAEMLHSRHIPVTFLVREKSFWNRILPAEESAMINRHILKHGIDLRLNSELKEIKGDEKGRAKAVVTKTGEEIACQFVGLAVGVSPNIDFLKDSGLETNRGILVDRFFRTNQPDVYAIGDCAEYKEPPSGRKAIEQVWYTGRIHGETVAQTILGNPTAYQPSVWFNSAKFMDIEYQVYGHVPALPDEKYEHLYWEHPSGEKSVRIVYEKESQVIAGFNLMGIRYRHEVCDLWIKTRKLVSEVLTELEKANFDPEFYDRYENHLQQMYLQKYPDQAMEKKKGWFGMFNW